MATIGDLLSRLEAQVNGLRWSPEDTASAHAAAWIPLAKATAQAITWLPLGGRSDQVKVGIRNVLAPLARGPLKSDEDVPAAPPLLELATTVGAIADSLAGILRWGPRPEQVGTPALALEAELLSAVHVVARWSRAAVEVQCPAPPRPPLATFLGDLIVVTEPYASIRPERRASTLEDLAFMAPSSSGVEGAMAAWAEIACSILDDRYRVSGWALQVIAADLALVSRAVQPPFALAGARDPAEASRTALVSAALTEAARSWRQAAAWPPHIRLGGQNPDLRLASRDLRDRLGRGPISNVAQVRRLLGLAVPIAATYVQCIHGLNRNHEFWIHAPFLVPNVHYQNGWIREPLWSSEGRPIMFAAESAHDALDRALQAIGVAHADSRSERPRWSPLPAPSPSRDPLMTAASAQARTIGPSPAV